MSRETSSTKKVALLATGDEISNGDILNTNAQAIARKLVNDGMRVGMHMVASDTLSDIEQAIRFLLQTHDALIITGGLGPTSDDLTRFALSSAIDKPLVFDHPTWQAIVDRLHHFGYTKPPESNRQQALFPEGADIMPNQNGTAAGCVVRHHQQLIFMLPGPPTECLTLLDQFVLAELKQAGYAQIEYRKSWLLFSVSEGQIAEEMDALAKPYHCTTGYRLAHPYLEFKIHSDDQYEFEKLVPQIDLVLAPYLIGNGNQMASELLRSQFETLNTPITICDLATRGLLESQMKTPKTDRHLHFVSSEKDHAQIVIKGLNEYWQEEKTIHTHLEIKFTFANKQEVFRDEIPFRGERVKQYAVEFICRKIYDYLFT